MATYVTRDFSPFNGKPQRVLITQPLEHEGFEHMTPELVENERFLPVIPDPELSLISIEEVRLLRIGTMGLSRAGGSKVIDDSNSISKGSGGIGSCHVRNSTSISDSGPGDKVIIIKFSTSLSISHGIPKTQDVSSRTGTLRQRTETNRLRHPTIVLGAVRFTLRRCPGRSLEVHSLTEHLLDPRHAPWNRKLQIPLEVDHVGRWGHLLLVDQVRSLEGGKVVLY